MKRALLLTALAITVAAIGATTAAAQGTISWSKCGGRFECATFTVPLDYADPSGTQIDLALIRQPARDPAKRVGSLLTNPGGPGGSGVDFVRAWAGSLSSDITDRFDIIGFDPRGVGESTPIVCHDNLKAWVAADPSPDSQSEWDTLARETEAFADGCAAKHSALLPFLGTKNVARDMDRMRAALGDAKLTYLGYSYGTVIGQVYADMFPGNVRAMVLDGAVDLALSTDDRTLTQIAGFDRALEAFIANCNRTNCRLESLGGAARAVDDLFRKAEEAPIPSKSADRPAGPGEVLIGLIEPLYSASRWSSLERAIEAGLGGDGSRLVQLTDSYLQRDPGGGYANVQEANVAVNCVDQELSKLPTRFADFPAAAARFAQTAPRFGPAVATGLTCAFWAAKPDALAPPRAAGVPPILVVSTSGDPATPYEWGVAVSKQLPGAVLLSYGGEGHTVYGGRDGCIDKAVNRYLVELTAPAPGTACGNASAIPAAVPTESATPAAPGSNASPAPSPAGTQPPPFQPAPNSNVPSTPTRRPWVWIVVGLTAGLAVVTTGVVAVRRR